MDKSKILKSVERALDYENIIETGMDTLDKMQFAFYKLFNRAFDSRGIMAFDSLADAYVQYSGDINVNGNFFPNHVSKDLRACMGFSSSSFIYALENVLSMRLSKSYKDFPYHEDIFISSKKNAKDFRTIHSVQIGSPADLPDIDPETQDYEDFSTSNDTEAQYGLGQKGGILWITRRIIINDSIDLIKAMVKVFARAARRTHSKYVWNFYLNNSSCPDGTAWFTGDHGNLGSDALDFSSIITGITALANMQEPSPSSEKIGIDLASFNWNLVVPVALWDTAIQKNQSDSYFTSNDLTSKVPNAIHKLFGDRNERIIVCPFESDSNDWGIIRDREDVPIVEMSYLNGHEEPEFIIHDGPTDEKVFTSDKIGYKIRHEYGGTLADYRGGYKASVA